ncbi:inactive pancreatic lipase-related protein 1-like, partial [Daphnia carinata]|uniref:inactive pancreatic lipase-related protein 1-like n=1 Tax=Daphnia carinata TaxID=120202 RepID=UPI0028690EAD
CLFVCFRRNPKVFEELQIGDVLGLTLSNYVRTNPTRIYVHGFLLREDCNFIAVDWSLLALALSYPTAASNVQSVGVLTGNLVNFLISQGADQSQFHLMGFSLGAHVVGRAGLTTNGRLPRITGFDPAFPCFDKSEVDDILDKTDAQFVDIIHTNAGTILDKRFGFPLALGHADFWPNGGSLQPGCGLVEESTAVKIGNILDIFDEACSHRRAVQYFAESINSAVPFNSTQCDSYSQFQLGSCPENLKTSMGLFVSATATGNFFLNTNSHKPFAEG